MNVFGIGLPEIAVIGVLALIVFGPKRLPELGKTLGKTLKGFQTASSEFEREIQKAMAEPETLDAQNTLDMTAQQKSAEEASPQNEELNPPSS